MLLVDAGSDAVACPAAIALQGKLFTDTFGVHYICWGVVLLLISLRGLWRNVLGRPPVASSSACGSRLCPYDIFE